MMQRVGSDRLWRWFVIGTPLAWMTLFLVIPFLIVLRISLADPIIGQPPYSPLLDADGLFLTLDSYVFLLGDSLYWLSYLKSVMVAGTATLACLLLGYPVAAAIARSSPSARPVLLVFVILPFWTSLLLRVYAWSGLLATRGLINEALLATGIIDAPLQLLYTDFAVIVGIVYTYLPFMILPLYATLEGLGPQTREAAADLGARPFRVFVDVTLPLSMPGVAAGCLLVFIPALGEFIIPAMLGGSDSLMIGRLLYDEFFQNRDWPLAAAVTMLLLVILVLPLVLLQRYRGTGEVA